jgi:thioredoxin-dependent peroxiredoxin
MVKKRIFKTSVMIVSILTFLFVVGFQISQSLAAEKESNPPATEKSNTMTAVEKGKDMAKIKIGDVAPAFDLMDQNGSKVNLKSFVGKKVLVYFYPKAGTPGCTKQACSLRDTMTELNKVGINVVGISPDAPDSQKKFADKNKLPFPLLYDSDLKVAESYGALGEKMVKGKASTGIIRSSFLIGEDGTISNVWYKVKPEKTASLAIDFLTKDKLNNTQKAPK